MFDKIRQIVYAASLSEKTQNTYIFYDNIDDIERLLFDNKFYESVAAYRSNRKIFRGDSSIANHLAAVAIPGIRKSQNTSNIYTRLMSDILSSWKQYPKRTRSFICSTSAKEASLYVEPNQTSSKHYFCVFPENDTLIGLCPKNDIWNSFESGLHFSSMNAFNHIMIQFFSNVLGISSDDITPIFLKDNDVILDFFDKVEKQYRQNPDINLLPYAIRNYHNELISGKSIVDILNEKMSPENNGFSLINIQQLPKYKNRECWFSSKCLMIRNDIIEKIIQ